MVHLSIVDLILLGVYFAAVLFIGFRAARKRKSGSDDYLLAGRTLTLPVFVATLVSTWYGGILGVGEYSYRYGLSNWFVFGVPYYFFALIFALFLAKKIRATNLYTIPDQLEHAFDRRTAIAGGILTFFLISPAAYVLMLGVLAQLMFGVDLTLAIVITTLVTIVYLYNGGFRSDVWANVFEFVLMFLGFALIIIFSYFKFGGLSYIQSHVPPLHMTWNGGHTPSYILVWFFIALWTIVDPAFHQRCYAAKDGKTARNGILVSIGYWFVFEFMTTSAGLYARASIPGLSQPMYSYPLLAEIALPAVAKGLFYRDACNHHVDAQQLNAHLRHHDRKRYCRPLERCGSSGSCCYTLDKIRFADNGGRFNCTGYRRSFGSRFVVHNRNLYYSRITYSGCLELF